MYINNKKNGTERQYNREGILIEECTYLDDQLHGILRRYDNTGLLMQS
jgi:antitoxin component YwqK of YwqJK toxin-antitoxin module